MIRIIFIIAVTIVCVFASVGCEPTECQQMNECCEAVEDLDGTGSACIDLTEDTTDVETCREVVRTVGFMLDERDKPTPEACQL